MSKPIRPDHIAAYIRWSTDDQAEGTTLEVQLDACRNYILSQGWQFRDDLVFIEDGYSGGSLKRPALTRLRQQVQDGQIDCLVVLKLDRLSRSVVDTVNLVLREWDELTFVKSAREPVDTTTAMGKQFFYMLTSYAEWERNVIRERMLSGKYKRAQEGRNAGYRRPYGYAKGAANGSFVIVEDEAAVVRRIFAMYVGGNGFQQIAYALTADGIRHRIGRIFSNRSIYEIIINRTYIGELVYGKTTVNPRRHLQEGAPRQIRQRTPMVAVKSDTVPPIVSRELFEQAQVLRLQRYRKPTPNRALASDHLLTGIARCGHCGSALKGVRQDPERRAKGCKGQYYVCCGKRQKGQQFCCAGNVRQDILDALIVQRLQEHYGGQLGRQRYTEAVETELTQEVAQVQGALQRLQSEAADLDKELAVIARDYRRELLNLAEYREQKIQVDQERAALREPAEAAVTRLQDLQHQLAARKGLSVVINRIPLWDKLTQAEKKHLLRQLVSGLRVSRAPGAPVIECEVTWMGESKDVLATPASVRIVPVTG